MTRRALLAALLVAVPASLAWLAGSIVVVGTTMDTGPQRRLSAVPGVLGVVWIVPALAVLLGAAAIARMPEKARAPLWLLWAGASVFGSLWGGALTIGPLVQFVVP